MIRTLKSIFRFLKPYTVQYIFGVIGMGVINFALLAYMAFVLADLTSSIVELDQALLIQTILNAIILIALTGILLWFSGIALVSSLIKVERDMRKAFFSRTLFVPLAVHHKYPSGELLSRFNHDLNESVALFKNSFQSLAIMLFQGIGSSITIFILDWVLGLWIVGICFGVFLLNVPILRRLRKASQKVQREKAGFLRLYSQLVSGQRIIRYFNLAGWIYERVFLQSETLKKAGIRRNTLEAMREAFSEMTFLGIISIMIIGGYRAIEDPTTLPTIIAIVQLQNGVAYLFSGASAIFAEITKRLAGVERLVEVMDIPEEPDMIPFPPVSPEHSAPIPALPSHKGLFVRNLSFAYPDSSRLVLNKISFEIAPGETVAFVGPSGSGKTTLFKVLLGFFAPLEGHVAYSGRSIYHTILKEWRAQFTYVPQDAFLFSGSIRKNLEAAFEDGSEGHLSDNRMKNAARLANAHTFIEDLESKYDFVLEEGGNNLSGGQRQRIALTRSFLREAPILLLDEATSALDSESERVVQEAVSRLMEGKTALVIAHRLSTVRQANCIYYMEDGMIIEQGTHESLMNLSDGRYRSMVIAGELEEVVSQD